MPRTLNSQSPGKIAPLMGTRSPTLKPKRSAVALPTMAPCLSARKACHWSSGTRNSGVDAAGRSRGRWRTGRRSSSRPGTRRRTSWRRSTSFTPGHAQDAVAVGDGQRLDERDLVDDQQAVGARRLHALVEGGADGDEQAEQEERHREGAHGEDRADLAAQEVREEQGEELHRAQLARTPLSRCRVAWARSAALGSWVTIRIVLPQVAGQLLQELQDLVRALAVEVAGGLVAEQEGGVGHDGAGDGHPLLLPAGQLARLVLRRGRPGPRCRARSARAACAPLARAAPAAAAAPRCGRRRAPGSGCTSGR